ncbi:peptidoglycan-binding protein [Calothrix sp. FACHB-156]|nr:peptidoglycan-binding protein [Calothrix sp. FACHB-156]
METLAFIQAAVVYEDPSPKSQLRETKNTNLKVSCSSAIALVTSFAVLGTIADANPVQATVNYGSTGSDVKKLQAALGGIPVDGFFGFQTLARLKSYQGKNGLAVDGIAGPTTLSSLGLSTSPKDKTTQLERYGKLNLINDTPYMAIITLHEPKEEYTSRYAYIPPCSKRTLLNTYSSSWKVSFNDQKPHLIGNFFGEKAFQVRTSKLNDIKEVQSCEYDLQKSQETGWPFNSSVATVTFENAPKVFDDVAKWMFRNADDGEKLGLKLTELRQARLANVNMLGNIAGDKVAVKELLDLRKLPQNIDIGKLDEYTRYNENVVSKWRNEYKQLKETGRESEFNLDALKKKIKQANEDCKQLFGFVLFKEEVTQETLKNLISTFDTSISMSQGASNTLDRSTVNDSTDLPKSKAANKSLEDLGCITPSTL